MDTTQRDESGEKLFSFLVIIIFSSSENEEEKGEEEADYSSEIRLIEP